MQHPACVTATRCVQSTGLVRHVFRLLDDSIRRGRPVPWVLLENVEALLDRHGDTPPAVHYVTTALEALGYHSWAQRTVCSAAFGVPNRRKRVFIVASWHGDARDVLLSQVLPPHPPRRLLAALLRQLVPRQGLRQSGGCVSELRLRAPGVHARVFRH